MLTPGCTVAMGYLVSSSLCFINVIKSNLINALINAYEVENYGNETMKMRKNTFATNTISNNVLRFMLVYDIF